MDKVRSVYTGEFYSAIKYTILQEYTLDTHNNMNETQMIILNKRNQTQSNTCAIAFYKFLENTN